MRSNCVECGLKGLTLPAEFVLLDEVVYQFKPLCDQHLQEYLVVLGEDMTIYCHIGNDAGILCMINSKLKFLTQQYTRLLNKEKQK